MNKLGSLPEHCWVWTGAKNRKGYGRFNVGGKIHYAHRVSFGLDQIPEGKEIDHICRNRSCVRPSHLRAVTHHENVTAPGCQVGIPSGQRKLENTHCPSGHPYFGANLYVSKDGWRQCKKCWEIRRQKKKEKGNSISHFTKVASVQITDPESFRLACAELGICPAGHKLIEKIEISDYYKNKLMADFAVHVGGKYYLGLKRSETNPKAFDLVADWDLTAYQPRLEALMTKLKTACPGVRPAELLQQALVRHTTKHTIVREYARQGFEAEVSEDPQTLALTVNLSR